jgi:hypothetical protein
MSIKFKKFNDAWKKSGELFVRDKNSAYRGGGLSIERVGFDPFEIIVPEVDYFFTVQSVLGAENIVAHYRLDELASSSAVDSSGNDINGTYNGPTLGKPTLIQYSDDYAADFDGTNDHVDFGVVPNFDFIHQTGIFTISMWVEFIANISFNYAISNAAQGSSSGVLIRSDNTNRIIASVEPASALNRLFSGTLSSGVYHVVFTGDGSNVYLYIDGTLVDSGAVDTTISASANHFWIGGYSPTNSLFWPGRIDEVTIADVHASAADVLEMYEFSPTPPLINLVSSRVETSGATVTGWINGVGVFDVETVNGSPQEAVDGGVEFDGTNDFLTLEGSVDNFKAITETGEFSIGFKIRFENIGAPQQTILQTKSTGRGIFVGTDGGTSFRFRTFNSSNVALWNHDIDLSALGYSNGDTINIAVIGDGTNSRIYIDGSLEDTQTIALQAGFHQFKGTIGRYTNTASGYFEGAVKSLVYYDEEVSLSDLTLAINS